jgi:hypothetical protein
LKMASSGGGGTESRKNKIMITMDMLDLVGNCWNLPIVHAGNVRMHVVEISHRSPTY